MKKSQRRVKKSHVRFFHGKASREKDSPPGKKMNIYTKIRVTTQRYRDTENNYLSSKKLCVSVPLC